MAGIYFFALNWKKSTTKRQTPAAIEVPLNPRPRFTFKKSEAVSPTVVHKTFMIQKKTVTSGTLLSIPFSGPTHEFGKETPRRSLSVILFAFLSSSAPWATYIKGLSDQTKVASLSRR